jgi:apolipoprotein N-acyltransferase
MKLPSVRSFMPEWKNAVLAVLSAVLLIFAFPDFEYWFLAWFGLVPLLWAIGRESDSTAKSFVLGWLWGVVLFFGTCWWLAYAPIHYASFPPLLAYFLLFCVTAVAAISPVFLA